MFHHCPVAKVFGCLAQGGGYYTLDKGNDDDDDDDYDDYDDDDDDDDDDENNHGHDDHGDTNCDYLGRAL